MSISLSLNESLIRLAAEHGLEVRFGYSKSDGSPIETRALIPERVFTTRNGEAVLVIGHDPYRDDDYRTFRLDRIKGRVSV